MLSYIFNSYCRIYKKQKRSWSDCAYAQSDQDLLCSHIQKGRFLALACLQIRFLILVFQITVDPSGLGFDLDVPIEVVIGSIPFASVAQQYGFSVQPPAIPPAPGAPDTLYTDSSTGQAPGLTMPNMRMCDIHFVCFNRES